MTNINFKKLFFLFAFALGLYSLFTDPGPAGGGAAVGGALLGLLGLSDMDRKTVNTIGQSVVYDAVQQYLAAYNAQIQAAMSVFIGGTTEDHSIKYKLPGGGRLDRRGGRAQSAARKAYGGWDVGFPLEEFGGQVAWTATQAAYLTAQELENHIETVRIQDTNTRRFEVLKAIFNNTERTFTDDELPTPTVKVQPLANNDSVVYPPLIGSESEAQDNHYLASGYAASSISDTNNPLITVRDELEEHFGTPTGFGNIAVFINKAQEAKISALADFEDVSDTNIRAGADTNVPQNLPNVPGRILGRSNGVWVVRWDWIPANYLYGQDLDQPGPVMERVDPAYTGFQRGLQLVATDERYPLVQSHWRNRFGMGVGNRLNGVCMELTADASYDIPTDYA